ncbi:MAG TPA: TlpA disulfide reductase family protein [Gemmatimonadaceae bacterium]|nr:TlpA disulfide reductase family protein [Gemmatimonadaceae bacterium]
MTARGVLLAVGAALLLAGVFVGGRALMRADRGSGGVTMMAPGFEAVTLDSVPQQKTLADYRGDVVLLNIWATWCGPCRWEMPSMQALHEEFADRGLRVVAVSIDHQDAGVAITEFTRSLGLTFEILHDTAGTIQSAYRTTAIPETAVIGRNGVIRKRVAGAELWNSPANRALVTRLLDESGP